MPIRPSQRWFYPIDWPELSRLVRFERAGGRCERCGRPHGRQVWHLSREEVAGRRGLWFDEGGAGGRWRCERGRAVPSGLLPAPAVLARCDVQLAFWPGLERPNRLRRSLVALACCHLDHDPTNNRSGNLAALCQHCHLEHDRADNLRRRAQARTAWTKAEALLTPPLDLWPPEPAAGRSADRRVPKRQRVRTDRRQRSP